MKKFIILCLAIGAYVSLAFGNVVSGPLNLYMRLTTPKPGDITIPIGGNPRPKSPVMAPEVYLDGDTLYFDEALEGCTVQLADEDETVVFTEFIEENQTSLTFPATLTGTFELQILTAQYIFYCEIEL